MSQIMYQYPAMMGHTDGMHGTAGTLRAIGSGIASEQSSLAVNWAGDTGMTYQAWQGQWNSALEELISAYTAMADAYGNGTTNMAARDAAEGGKWA
jgi:WXG100 family type VII secretion target